MPNATEATARYRLPLEVFDMLPLAALMVSKGGEICRANLVACEQFGVEPHAPVGELAALLPEPERALLRQRLSELFSEEFASAFSLEFPSTDREEECCLRCVRLAEDPELAIATIHRRRASAPWQQFLSQVFDTVEVAIDVVSARGEILLCNSYQSQLTGRSLADVRGLDWFDTFIVPEDRQRLRTRILGSDAWSASGAQVEGELQTSAKGRRRMRWSISPIRRAGDEVIGHLLVGKDCTARAHSERLLRRGDGILRAVIESCSDAVLVLDGLGVIELANPAAEKLLQMPLQTLVGRSLAQLVSQSNWPLLEEVLSTASDETEARQLEVGFTSVDGTEKPTAFVMRTIHAGDETLHCCIARPVAESQSETRPARGALPERLAHDLNSLIMGIDGCAAMALDALQGAPEIGRFVAQIRHSTRAAQQLVTSARPRLARASEPPPEPAPESIPVPGETDAGASNAEDGGRPILLLVDDDDTIRLALRHQLRDLGWEVLEAADGDQALELLQQHEGAIDGVALDVVLPGRMGVCVAREILAKAGTTPIVFMSGYPRSVALQEELVSPESLFVEKPVNARTLHEILRGQR